MPKWPLSVVYAVQRTVDGTCHGGTHFIALSETVRAIGKEDEAYGVRHGVAANPSTPAEVLAQLARDREVRWEVAQNPSPPAEVLSQLIEDEDRGVRSRVAHNPNAPVEALTSLTVDEDKWVRTAARDNPNFPIHIRAMVSLAE